MCATERKDRILPAAGLVAVSSVAAEIELHAERVVVDHCGVRRAALVDIFVAPFEL